jgi:hypothetical protein
MAAIECIPAIPRRFFKSQKLNVCFSRKRPFNFNEKHQSDGPLTAKSGRLATLVPGRSPPTCPRHGQLINDLATSQEMIRCSYGKDHVFINFSGTQSESIKAWGTNLLEQENGK